MSHTAQGPATITRFAPSPTGPLHLGHLLSVAFVWATAKALGARIILRIEDHDKGRCRKHFEEQILRDLDWLGFVADDGVTSTTAPSPFRQSDCQERYAVELAQLRATQSAYPCYCSRREIAQLGSLHGANTQHGATAELTYPGTCRNRTPSQTEHGWRWILPEEVIGFDDLWCGPQVQVPQRQCGDLLLQERSGSYTYQFCVTSDDIAQGVNLVVRGQDLLNSTGRQLQLRRALMSMPDKNSTLRFLHHPLIADETGRKLSKKDLDRSLADYRQEGQSPQALLRAAIAHIPGYAEALDYQSFCHLIAKQLTS